MNKADIKNITGSKYFDDWFDIVKDVIFNEEFVKRLYFPHHGKYNVYTHCIKVSYDSYIFSLNKKVDSRKCALAGLLHDFYPYLWRYSDYFNILGSKYYEKLHVKKPLLKKHAFMHGKEASLNYVKFFPNLDDEVITDSIKSHMFPLTLPPRYKVGWIITLFDKVNAVRESQTINAVKMYLYIFIYLQVML